MDVSSTAVLQGMSFLDGAILVLYLVGLTAIALYHSRKMHSQEDYFLAGRSMSRNRSDEPWGGGLGASD